VRTPHELQAALAALHRPVTNALAACELVGRSPPYMGDDVRRTHEPSITGPLRGIRSFEVPKSRLSPGLMAKVLHEWVSCSNTVYEVTGLVWAPIESITIRYGRV